MSPAQLSSARQRTAAPAQQSRVLCPYPAVLCGTGRWRAVLRAVLYLLFVHARRHSTKYHTRYSSTEVHHTRFARTTLLNPKNALPAQLSSVIAQQRAAQPRAVPSGAVRCRALPCGAVRCCALLRYAFFRRHSTRYHAKYQVPGTGMFVRTLLFAFFINCPPSRSCSCFPHPQVTLVLPIRM